VFGDKLNGVSNATRRRHSQKGLLIVPGPVFFLLIEISVIFGGPLYEKEKKGVETPDLIIKLDHKCLLMYSY
jgi:hypothetical protein